MNSEDELVKAFEDVMTRLLSSDDIISIEEMTFKIRINSEAHRLLEDFSKTYINDTKGLKELIVNNAKELKRLMKLIAINRVLSGEDIEGISKGGGIDITLH